MARPDYVACSNWATDSTAAALPSPALRDGPYPGPHGYGTYWLFRSERRRATDIAPRHVRDGQRPGRGSDRWPDAALRGQLRTERQGRLGPFRGPAERLRDADPATAHQDPRGRRVRDRVHVGRFRQSRRSPDGADQSEHAARDRGD